MASTTASPAQRSARALRSRKAMPSGTAVAASPALWIRSASSATEPEATKTIACRTAVAARIASASPTARRPSRERLIESWTRPWLCGWACELTTGLTGLCPPQCRADELECRCTRARGAVAAVPAVPALRRPRLGRAGGADRDDQARVRRPGGLDRRGAVQEGPRRLPGPARPGGARALRVLRARARGPAGRAPRRPRLHAPRLPADA